MRKILTMIYLQSGVALDDMLIKCVISPDFIEDAVLCFLPKYFIS